MAFSPIEKPLDSIAKKGTKEALKGLGSSVKEGLGSVLEMVVKQSKDIFKWFGNFFDKVKEKGLKESLMGPFIGFLNSTESLPKEEKESPKKKEIVKKEKSPEAIKETDSAELARLKLKKEIEEAKAKPKPEPFDQDILKSNPWEVGENGITLCSKTAKLNLSMLAHGKTFASVRPHPDTQEDIKKIRENAKAGEYRLEDVIPTGNADDIQQFYITARHEDLVFGDAKEKIRTLNLSGKTVCDIVTKGSTKYDHRAAGFKGNDGNWYVLDPYRSKRETNPIPFQDYEEKYHTDILFVVPIDNSGASNPSPTPLVS